MVQDRQIRQLMLEYVLPIHLLLYLMHFSLQSSQNFHIDINERWYMDVGIDLDNESAEITRVTLKSDFRKEGQSC